MNDNGYITIHKRYLKTYLAVKEKALIVHIDSRCVALDASEKVEEDGLAYRNDENSIFYTLNIGNTSTGTKRENYSYIFAKNVIWACSLCDSNIWPYNEEKNYVDFIIGIDENGKEKGEGENWINVGYKHSGPYAKVLSNLFPYEFVFKGKKLNSIESFFQGIKFKDPQLQDIVFTYGGLDSNYIQACSEYNWKENGIVFWQGKEIDRYSEKYDDLIDELYISAIQNPLYRNVLKNCTKEIIHTMGKKEKSETTFTRYEFEKQLNCLKEFLKKESN